jgi:hypothetical protein
VKPSRFIVVTYEKVRTSSNQDNLLQEVAKSPNNQEIPFHASSNPDGVERLARAYSSGDRCPSAARLAPRSRASPFSRPSAEPLTPSLRPAYVRHAFTSARIELWRQNDFERQQRQSKALDDHSIKGCREPAFAEHRARRLNRTPDGSH